VSIQNNSFNVALLVSRYSREEVARPEIPPSITPGTNSDTMTLSWAIWTLLSLLMYYNGLKRWGNKVLLRAAMCDINDSTKT